jgi:pimeloyl-ACP methyl ester carboxylesterase
MVLFDDCGHVPHREHPHAVVAEVRRFIETRVAFPSPPS